MADRTIEKDERKRALDLALSQIEKQYGKGAIMRLGTAEIPADVPAISSGSLGLDLALGVGGFPRGRVIEIFGPEASGKTTLSLHVIAEAQKAGGVAAFIDAKPRPEYPFKDQDYRTDKVPVDSVYYPRR